MAKAMEMAAGSEAPYTLWQSRSAEDAAFVVCAMFTSDYLPRAERLLRSLRELALPHALFKVPSVHRSISPQGNDDLAYSKPRFVAWAVRQFARPVLYVDADCCLRERPELLPALRTREIDFAAYNWLFDVGNDSWLPLASEPWDGTARYWRYGHSVPDWSSAQLVCSGAVQYWANTPAASALLQRWELNLTEYPGAPDDHCLDYAFNFPVADAPRAKVFWLPKEYARYLHWPYVRPVIDHPDLPAGMASSQYELLGDRRFDATRLLRDPGKTRALPRMCIVDTVARQLLLRDAAGELKPVAPLTLPLYL
jgi:hypothetical protein